jgi:CHAT domain-containing protein
MHMKYEQTKDLKWAEGELNAYRSAFQLIDYVERTYDSDEARLFLDRIKYQVHGKPIDIAYTLYQKTNDEKFLEELYVFDQQNKASILSVRRAESGERNGKDTSDFIRIQSIKTEITRLSIRAAQVNDSAAISLMNKRIRDLEIQLGKLQDKLIKSSGSISKIPTVKSLQQDLLDDNTAVVSFHLSDSALTSLVITKKNFNVFQQPLFTGFHEAVQSYVEELRMPGNDTSYREISHKLYQFLFSRLNVNDKRRWLIIPDDELNYLPFESLIDEKGNYAVTSHTIQYQYTTALLKKETSDFSNLETLAFAPFTKSGYKDSLLHLDPLPNSLNEIENTKGQKFIGVTATKQQFLSTLSSYPVIHLATHAVARAGKDGLSFIAFSPGINNSHDFLLYEEEIYNLPLEKTKLILLSACETASGDLVRGEGIMSLSRAFTYAGCPDILTTLWNANDFSTGYLTSKVHHYLNARYSIDHALQQAKMDYLMDKSVNPRLKHPFYWSHFIFIGNYEPEEKNGVLWWVIAGVILLIFISLAAKKSRN